MTRRTQRSGESSLKVAVAIIFALFVFWNMISSYEGGNLGDIFNEENETIVENVVLVDQNVYIDRLKYEIIPFEARRGDILNVSIQVFDGGPIDYFLMETEKKVTFENWFNRTVTRFFTYDNGKGLNVTYHETEFTVIKTDTWYIIVNNYGHMKDGAFPRGNVAVHVTIIKVGTKKSGGWFG